MIQFVCDSCGAIKTADEEWILGLAVENVGVTAARRQVTILGAWDETRARERFAVHFCSERCKNKYMMRVFDQPPSMEVTSDTGEKMVEMARRQTTLRRRVTQRRKAK